ncbi:MAG: hypothetical protein H8D38_04635 [DPANN group archaeon]|nr:hypothetical protein [DPANN group archaeon]
MKKGQTPITTYTTGMVILIICIIIGFLLVKTWTERTNTVLDESDCEKSVLSHIKMLKLSKSLETGEPMKATPIKCPRIDLTLKQKDEDEIKHIIAEKMRICWKNWQRGEEELFLEEATYCQPCYIIDFKHKNLEIRDFDKFLIETKILRQNYTYMQYFSGSTNNEEFATEKLKENPDIAKIVTSFKTDSKKVILFYYTKDSDMIKEIIGTLEGFAKGAAIGGTAGAIIVGGVAGTICSIIPGVGTISCATIGAKIGAIIGGATGGFIAAQFLGDYPLWLSFILFKEYNEEELRNLGCEIAPGKQTNK